MDQSLSINCNGKLVSFSVPKVMGILNMTPDSFFDGGRNTEAVYNAKIDRMVEDGCDILDIGGMSSRPGAKIISAEDDWHRIQPALQYARKHYPGLLISVDTIHSSVATRAVENGADIINDISAGEIDKHMISAVAALNVPYVAMHMPGTPDTMHEKVQDDDIVLRVLVYLKEKVHLLREAGIKDIIVDPGFGFGKTTDQNFELLQKLSVFRVTEAPILVGISRKSLICKTLNVDPQHALNGTTALHMIALQNGASILRVHDVKEARQCVLLHEALKQGAGTH